MASEKPTMILMFMMDMKKNENMKRRRFVELLAWAGVSPFVSRHRMAGANEGGRSGEAQEGSANNFDFYSKMVSESRINPDGST